MQYGSGLRPRFRQIARHASPAAIIAACLALAHPASAKTGSFTGLESDYLVGRFAADQGDMHTAATEFLKAVAADPETPGLRLQAFLVSALDGRAEAVDLAKTLPHVQPAQLLLANQQAMQGQWEQAEQSYAALTRDNMTQLLQPLLVAWAQQGAGRTEAALATLRPYQTGPRRAAYMLHTALIADMAGRSDAATLYRNARAAYTDLNLRLAQVEASWQARQKHMPDAQAVIRALVAQSPELGVTLAGLQSHIADRALTRPEDGLAESYLALAASLRRQDSTDTALLMLRFALTLRPDFTAARLLVADLHEQQKHYAAAMDALAPVTADDALIGLVRLRRAVLAGEQGDTDGALKQLVQLAHDAPNSAVPLMQQGDVLREARRFHEAVQAYTAALTRVQKPSRSDWSVYYARAIAYDGEHDWAHAEKDLERALRLSPDQPSVMNYLGYSLTEQGHSLPRARQLIEKAAEERPNEGAIIDSLGWVMLRQGEVPGALETLQRAVELEPEDPVINAHLGDAYHAAGQDLDAEYQWQRALTFHPTPEETKALETKLRNLPPTHTAEGKPAEPLPADHSADQKK